MPSITVRVPATGTLAAGATADNIFAGSIYEYMPYPAYIELAIVADGADVLATVNSGSDTLAEESPVVIKAANTLPVYPDDYVYTDEAMMGDRFKVKLRNAAGAARTAFAIARITPL